MLIFLGIMTVLVPQTTALFVCHQDFDSKQGKYRDGVIPFLNITLDRNEDCEGMCAYFEVREHDVTKNEEHFEIVDHREDTVLQYLKDRVIDKSPDDIARLLNGGSVVAGCYPKGNQTGLFAAKGGDITVVGFACNQHLCNNDEDPHWKRALKLKDDVVGVAAEVKEKSTQNGTKKLLCHDEKGKSKQCNGFCSMNYNIGPTKIESSTKCSNEYKYATEIKYVVLAKTKEVPEVRILCKFDNCNTVKNSPYSQQLERLTGHFQELLAAEPEEEVVTQSANGLLPLLFISGIFAVFNF